MSRHDEDPRVVDLLRPVPEELRDKPFYISQGPADKVGELSASRAIKRFLKLNAGRGKLYRVIDEGTCEVRLQAGDDGDIYTSLRWYARWTVEVGDAQRARREKVRERKRAEREKPRESGTTDEDEATLAEFGIGQKNTARPKNGRAARDDNSATTKSKESTHA